MSVKMQGRYLGNKNVEIVHLPSSTKITTSAPIDNNGDGNSFSPTDLFSASAAACMLTIMGIVAERDKIDLKDLSFEVEKHMQDSPRRVAKIEIKIHMPKGLSEVNSKKLKKAALSCPVHKSVHSDVEISCTFL